MPMTVYHGTSSTNLESIKAKGLLPGVAPGADKWAAKNRLMVAVGSRLLRPPSVYVTSELEVAKRFARLAALISGGKPIVLRMTLPDEVFDGFVEDEMWSDDPDNQVVWRGPAVPAQYIRFPEANKVHQQVQEKVA